jgi:predicted transposase YdaD
LTQLAILAGLRGASEQLTIEFKAMGVYVEIEKNAFLRNIRDDALAEGRAQGQVEGRAQGMIAILRNLLLAKYGRLPRWAEQRLAKATPAQAERWATRVLTAGTLEGILGER